MRALQHRSVVMAPNGIAATGHYLASAAGLEVLVNGGNAVDAAFTAAAVMGVVQPIMSGPRAAHGRSTAAGRRPALSRSTTCASTIVHSCPPAACSRLACPVVWT